MKNKSTYNPKVIVYVNGGLVQDVYATTEDVDVIVIDSDTNGIPDEDLMTDEDINNLLDDKKFVNISFDRGSYREKGFDSLIRKILD